MLCNSYAYLTTSSTNLGMLCNVLGMLCILDRPWHASARSQESHIEEKPPLLAVLQAVLQVPKMCRHLRCVGTLCNSQACLAISSADLGMLCNVLDMLCNVLGMLATFLADLGMLLQGPKSPTSKRNPPTCCL